NKLIYKHKCNKIITKIEKVFNKQNIIDRLREELDERYNEDNLNKSLDTIVYEKKIYKKEKCFRSYEEATYLSKFILYNRTKESFTLIISLFKQCINEYRRVPYVYIDFWLYLHSIRCFISKNNIFYEDAISEINYINKIMDRILYNLTNLELNLKLKYLVYFMSFCNEMDKPQLITSKDSVNANNFELKLIKNQVLDYHIKSLHGIQNFGNAIKNLNGQIEINSAQNIYDESIKVLILAEKSYALYVNKFGYLRETLQLYSLFLNNVMGNPEQSDEFLNILSNNEVEANDKKGKKYEKSEGISSLKGDSSKRKRILKKNLLSKCQKPLYNFYKKGQYLLLLAMILGIIFNFINVNIYSTIESHLETMYIGYQAPYIISRVKSDIRYISVGMAANETKFTSECVEDLKNNFKFLKNSYIPSIYDRHSLDKFNLYTVDCYSKYTIEETYDQNYFQNLMRIMKYITKILDKYDKISLSDIKNYLDERMFIENYGEQIDEIIEDYSSNDTTQHIDMSDEKTNKKSSTGKLKKYIFIYFGIVTILFTLPYLFVFVKCYKF
ncbi:hypothetical protein LY90DRAFT_647888, partial [Neocallimastix californiae]